MIDVSFLEKLLDGVEVDWKALGSVCTIETGKLNANAAVNDGAFMFFTTAKEPSRINEYRWDTEALLIAGNANVGEVKHYSGKFEAYQRTYVLTNFANGVSIRFLYYVLSNDLKKHLEERTNSAAMTYIVLSTLEDFQFPIPCPDDPKKSLEIQSEIVRILDTFTELTTELTTELNLRKEQYEYYRDQLLSFEEGEVEWKALGEVAEIYGGLTGKSKADFDGGNAKYITYKNIFSNLAVDLESLESVKISDSENQHCVEYGDVLFTGSSETADEAGMSSVVTSDFAHPIYLNSFSFGLRFKAGICIAPDFSKHLFRCSFMRTKISKSASGVTRFNISKERFRKIPIPIPCPDNPKKSLEIQSEIVRILDTFTELTAELTAELKARKKQYEYYRDLLLSFPKPDKESE